MVSQPITSHRPSPITGDEDLKQILGQIQKLIQSNQLDSAYNKASALAKDFPNNSAAHYLLAVCQRHRGEYKAALKSCDRLLLLRPDHGRAFQERAQNLVQLRDTDRAITAFQQAVDLNPALSVSWHGLAVTLRQRDRLESANEALEEFKRLSLQPPVLVSVASMIYEKRLQKAEKLCRAFLGKQPHHPEAMRLLARISLDQGVTEEAESLLANCLDMYPDCDTARFDYIDVLLKRRKLSTALEQARHLRKRLPESRRSAAAYAKVCIATGKYDIALSILDRLLTENASLYNLHLARGQVLAVQGESGRAAIAYRAAYLHKPDFGDAYWSLANIKKYRFSKGEIEQMKNYESASTTTLNDRLHLCFALGKAHEALQEYASSFHYYQRGNSFKQQQCRYNSAGIEQDVKLQKRHCTPELFIQKADLGCLAPDPIFVIGLPRAGVGLLEQILTSHSQVDNTLELPNIPALALELNGHNRTDENYHYPASLGNIGADALRELSEQYIEDSRAHRSGNKPFFIDKTPDNFRHIGLIHLMLPRAKIIDLRRHPMACCFSGYKHLFTEDREFTYSLHDIGTYYRNHTSLMDHWHRVLPGKILRIHYEEMVTDLSTTVERLLTYCGLPFEEACLTVDNTDHSAATASSEQIKQSAYRNSTAHWRHFDRYLQPLKQALGTTIDDYPHLLTEAS